MLCPLRGLGGVHKGTESPFGKEGAEGLKTGVDAVPVEEAVG